MSDATGDQKGTMSCKDAAEAVLKQAGKPMHYRDIARYIQAQGLWQSTGQTPEATVNSRINNEVTNMGDRSRFVRTGDGTYALREWNLSGNTSGSPSADTVQQPATQPKQVYSFTDAAEYVLENYANKQPMHYRQITDRILDLDLVNTQGATPEATLYSLVLTEIKRNTKQGKAPRFVQYGQGMFGLRRWMAVGLAGQIEQQNRDVRKKLLDHIKNITAKEFEQLIGRLLGYMGFEDVVVTRYGGDGGIDVRGTLVVGDVIKTKMAIQAKKWQNNVQAPIVQQVRGSLGTHEQGMIITTSDFSDGAKKEAARPDAVPVALVNGQELVELLITYQILVKRVPYELINLDVGDGTP